MFCSLLRLSCRKSIKCNDLLAMYFSCTAAHDNETVRSTIFYLWFSLAGFKDKIFENKFLNIALVLVRHFLIKLESAQIYMLLFKSNVHKVFKHS